MSSQKNAEVGFWKQLYYEKGDYGFNEVRKNDLHLKTKYFPGIFDEQGIGLDCGCGFRSVFEHSKLRVVAIDPLLEEYRKISNVENTENVSYIEASGEELPFDDGYFDFVFCVNVIDHTPNPKKMAEELMRVLKKGGKLYFEVNFDDALSPAHYGLWNHQIVNEMFNGVNKNFEYTERNNQDNQWLYHAIYEKT